MHSVSRVVHFEQLAHFRDERQLSASDSRNLVHRRHDSVCCSLHASAMDVPLVGPGVDAILGLGWCFNCLVGPGFFYATRAF